MDLKRKNEHILTKCIFANLYYEEKVDEKTYHQLLNMMLYECNPPMKSIEERFDDIKEY